MVCEEVRIIPITTPEPNEWVVLAGSVAILQGVSSTGTSLYIVDKDQGVGLTALTLSMRVERLAAPSQVNVEPLDHYMLP